MEGRKVSKRVALVGEMRLKFGGYKGRKICDVPPDYLCWLGQQKSTWETTKVQLRMWLRYILHNPGQCRFPFGAHRGKLIEDIKIEYLDWLLEETVTDVVVLKDTEFGKMKTVVQVKSDNFNWKDDSFLKRIVEAEVKARRRDDHFPTVSDDFGYVEDVWVRENKSQHTPRGMGRGDKELMWLLAEDVGPKMTGGDQYLYPQRNLGFTLIVKDTGKTQRVMTKKEWIKRTEVLGTHPTELEVHAYDFMQAMDELEAISVPLGCTKEKVMDKLTQLRDLELRVTKMFADDKIVGVKGFQWFREELYKKLDELDEKSKGVDWAQWEAVREIWVEKGHKTELSLEFDAEGNQMVVEV